MICWFENSGIPIYEIGFRQFIALSVAKGNTIIPQGVWINDGDRYLSPNKS